MTSQFNAGMFAALSRDLWPTSQSVSLLGIADGA